MQDHDGVSLHDRGQTMRDHDRGALLSQAVQRILQQRSAFWLSLCHRSMPFNGMASRDRGKCSQAEVSDLALASACAQPSLPTLCASGL